jgi:hypothetical protein
MANWDLAHWQMVMRTIYAVITEECQQLTPDQIGIVVRGCRERGWQVEHIREYIRTLRDPIDPPAPPVPPMPPTPPTVTRGRAEIIGRRAVGGNGVPKLWLGISRFYWGGDWIHSRDRVLREMDLDAAHGYDYARVFAQVQNIGSDTYWSGRETVPSQFSAEAMVDLTQAAAARGLRVAWTLIGKGGSFGPADRWRSAHAFVVERTAALQECQDGVLFVEMMNEPGAVGGVEHYEELQELYACAVSANRHGLLLATGATWSEHGATAFSPHTWVATKGRVGIVHLDRNLGGHEEAPDRPWRQPWDVGLLGDPWVDGEPIGPGASVNTESDSRRLTGHRAVAFLCGAFASCLHGEPGIRGLSRWDQEPVYRVASLSKACLPPNLANGRLYNANANFPGRPFDIPDECLRALSGGHGIIRAYTSEVDNIYYTIAFGMTSPFRLIAQWPMRVWINTQDRALSREHTVDKGDSIHFGPEWVAHRYAVLGSERL